MPFPVPSVSEDISSTPASSVAIAPSWAGVSFVFEDAFWCDWLYREFDGLRVPRSLIHRPSRHGLPYPDRLSVSPDPADPVQLENYAETLRTAQHLVVIVSPNSGRSELMREHMRAFRAAGGEERIVALVVKGEPGSPTAEPAALTDREWMPLWLQWRFSEAGFSDAERSEPLVVDARMGVATLPEVRSQLLAAMLEVNEAQLSELGVVPRASTRPSIESQSSSSGTEKVSDNAANTDRPLKGTGWMTAAIALTSSCAIGGLLFIKMQQDAGTRGAKEQKSPMTQSPLPTDEPWKPGAPVVATVAMTSPTPAKQLIAGGPVVEIAVQGDTDSRDFKILTERRERLFLLAESRLESGAHEEAYDILKQTAEIATLAIRKSGAEVQHLLRSAEVLRRLGQTAIRLGAPAEARGFYERGRQMILDARKKSARDTDGAAILTDIDAGLQKLPAQ